MRLPRDILSKIYIKPRIFLCEVDKERVCQLETTNTKGSLKFNSYSELSFDVGRTYNDFMTGETKVNPYYNKVEALRLIEVENIGYFEIQGPEITGNGIEEKKSITAYSSEYTLSQKYIENFTINTGTTGSIEVTYAEEKGDINNIKPVTLYNPDVPELSLLHLVLKYVYGWKIGHIDVSLQTLSRQFEVDRESVYDFLMNEVCQKFNCYIVFDTINNVINIYAESLVSKFIGDGSTNKFIISPPFSQIGTVSVNGYKTTKWQYDITTGAVTLEEAPASGAIIEVVDGALTEWETDVFVSFDNLSQEINVSYDADSIKTKLTVTYGDDYDIRETNLGLPYLTDISYYYTVDWMGQDLYDAYTAYVQKSNRLQSGYADNSQEILKINDKIYYEENRLWNANEKYYSNVAANVTEEKMSNLYKVLQKYFNNENEDNSNANPVITSWKTDLNALSRDFEFMEEYTLNYLSTELSKINSNRTESSSVETAIDNFLSEVWEELGRTPLQKMYLEPYQARRDANIEAGWSDKKNDNYDRYYPVLLYISSIETAIKKRDDVISAYEKDRDQFYNKNAEIADQLTMDNNFTEKQLIKLSAFMREDELHIDDIVETSQDDLSSSFRIKQDAMESGRIELQKISQPQLQFSMTMANIYALPEFEPIIDQFQLGKVIKVALRPDYIKQSRLLQVDINLDDFSDFSCEFGELTSLRSQSDIHADLLKNAITAGKSVATNSGRWTKGADTITAIELKLRNGLLDATQQIKAIDGSQGVVIDKNGIWLTKTNPDGSTSPYQTRIVNNMILMSDDGFKTSRSALGEIVVDGETYYGLMAEMVLSGIVESSKIIGGTIQIGEYLDDEQKTRYRFEVDEQGNVIMNAASIEGYVTDGDMESAIQVSEKSIMTEVSSQTSGLSSRIEQNEKNISLVVNDGKIETASIIAAINDDGDSEIKLNADKISLEGAITANETFKINEDGYFSAIGGTIGGWSINETSIYSGAEDFGNPSGMYFGKDGLSLGDNFKVTPDGTVTIGGGSSIGGYTTSDFDNMNSSINNTQNTVQNIQGTVNTINSQKMYRVEVKCSGSQVMSVRGQSATLSCHVYSWDSEITDQINASEFRWIRTSNNPEQDNEWNNNAQHIGFKTLIITTEDIINNASFSCEVNLPE